MTMDSLCKTCRDISPSCMIRKTATLLWESLELSQVENPHFWMSCWALSSKQCKRRFSENKQQKEYGLSLWNRIMQGIFWCLILRAQTAESDGRTNKELNDSMLFMGCFYPMSSLSTYGQLMWASSPQATMRFLRPFLKSIWICSKTRLLNSLYFY